MAEPKRANLLGLPTELRLRIYDYVLSFDTGRLAIYDPAFPSGHEWRFKYEGLWLPKDGFGTRIIRHDASLPRISWVSLQSTCSTIRSEVESHMRSPAAATAAAKANDKNGDEAAYTYGMRITAARGNLSGVVWTSLPCTPEQCRVLTAHITFPGAAKFWGDGGPMPILGELYQTLNRFLHYGPMLDAKTPLRRGPLRVEKLVVLVKLENGVSDEARDCFYSHHPGSMMYEYVQRLGETGLLHGFVGRVVVVEHGPEGEERVVGEMGVQEQEQRAEVPKEWLSYGFGWGVDTETSTMD